MSQNLKTQIMICEVCIPKNVMATAMVSWMIDVSYAAVRF